MRESERLIVRGLVAIALERKRDHYVLVVLRQNLVKVQNSTVRARREIPEKARENVSLLSAIAD